jgi:hypothetical protein
MFPQILGSADSQLQDTGPRSEYSVCQLLALLGCKVNYSNCVFVFAFSVKVTLNLFWHINDFPSLIDIFALTDRQTDRRIDEWPFSHYKLL